MLPRLYDSSSNVAYFNHNGYGFFDKCTKCEVTEERNGEYTLYLECLSTDRLINKMAVNMIIKAMANSYDLPQLFIIRKIAIDKYGNAAIDAQHIKSAFHNLYTTGLVGGSVTGTPEFIMNELLSTTQATPFNFISDIETTAKYSKGTADIEKIGDICGGAEGSLLDVFGGEYKYNNFSVKLCKARGSDKGVRIRYGSSISDYKQTMSADNVYTHILPYATVHNNDTDKDVKFVYPQPIATNAQGVALQRVLAKDFTSKFKNFTISSAGSYIQVVNEKLLECATAYIDKHNSIKTPIVNISVTCTSELEKLHDIRLCDTVKVVYGPLKTITTAKLTKTIFDSLTEKYVKMDFGDKTINLISFLKNNKIQENNNDI